MVENARLTGAELVVTSPPLVGGALKALLGGDVDDWRIWRTTSTSYAATPDDPEQTTTVRRLTDRGIEQLSTYGAFTLVFDPPLLEVPADVHDGSSWSGAGGATADGAISYASDLTAAATGAHGCLRVTGHVDLREDGQELQDLPIDEAWCPGRGVTGEDPAAGPPAFDASAAPVAAATGPVDAGDWQVRTRPPVLADSVADAVDTGGVPSLGLDVPPAATADGGLVVANTPGRDVLGLTPAHEALVRSWVGHPGGAVTALGTSGQLTVAGSTTRDVDAYGPRGGWLWDRPLSDVMVASPLAVDAGHLVLTSLAGDVEVVDPATGRHRWAARMSDQVRVAPATDGEHVVVGDVAGQVSVFTASSGGIRWTVEGQPVQAAGIVGDTVVVLAGPHVIGYRLDDGRRRWAAPIDGLLDAAVVDLGPTVVAASGDETLGLDADTGAVRWSADGADRALRDRRARNERGGGPVTVVLCFVADVLGRVFVAPVREGRLRTAGWPTGLRSVSALALAAYVAAAAVLLAAPWARRHSVLDSGLGGEVIYPRWSLFVFLALAALTLALLHAASLHLPAWLRIGVLVVSVLALVEMAITPLETGRAPHMVSWVGSGLLALLTAVRWRARFRWWEFATSFLVIGVTMAVVTRLVAREEAQAGLDATPTALTLTMGLVSVLAVPFTFVAGLAFAQLALLLAHRASEVVRDRVRRTWPVALLVAVVAAVDLVLVARRLAEPTATGASRLAESASGAVVLAAAVGAGLLLQRQRHRVDGLDGAVLAASVALVVLAALRRLGRSRLVALGAVLGIALAWSVRSTFDAPFVALFGLGATAAVFLGVLWATLTDAAEVNDDSAAYPRPARVQLFFGNAVLTMTALAFLAVTRAGQVGIDLSGFAALGDTYLGTGLALAAYSVLVGEAVAAPAMLTSQTTPKRSVH